MAYFIYNTYSNNQIYRIAENDSDLNALGIIESSGYLVISTSQENFDAVKLNVKKILNYNGSSVQLEDSNPSYQRGPLTDYITFVKNTINEFLKGRPQNSLYTQFNNYLTYLNSLNVNSIIPDPDGKFNMSLEQYINSTGNTYYSFLQIP